MSVPVYTVRPGVHYSTLFVRHDPVQAMHICAERDGVSAAVKLYEMWATDNPMLDGMSPRAQELYRQHETAKALRDKMVKVVTTLGALS